jgi:uncharacterized protein involved in outer membrane biogenesis
LRNLLIGIGIILVLLVGAVIAVPRLVGTAQLTAFLTERLRGATGYNVSIRGPVALSVLPSPTLAVGDLHVTGAGPDGAELARAGSIEVHVALLPLIGGRVEVTAVTVRDPVVTLDGPSKAVKPVPQAPPAPETTPGSSPTPAGSKFSVDVRHVRVTNGSFAYRDGDKTYQVDHLDLDLTTGADGAISGSAGTDHAGDALRLQGRIGAIDCARPIPLLVHATAAAGAATVDFDGAVGCDKGVAVRADGKLKLAADSLGAALAPFTGRRLPPALDKRLTLDATLGADRTRADLTDVTLDLDQTHGVGMLAARLADRPSIDLTLDFNRLDLDKWLEKAEAGPPAAGGPTQGAVQLAAAAPIAPPRLHIGLDLSAELLSWRGGLIRQVRFNGGFDQGTVTINQATAELPGGTDLAISGQVADAFATPHFIGTIDAETDDLRSVVGWAGVRLVSIPADRLRQASLSTSLDLAADRAAASGIDLELDGSRFKGAANLMFGDRPAIGLRLAGDQLNLDAYLTDAALNEATSTDAPPVAAFPVAGGGGASAGGPVVAAAALLPVLAANLDLTLDNVTWHGQLLKAVHLAGAVDDGAVTVRDARIGDLGGGAVGFSGRWAGGPASTATLSGQLTASGPSAAPLLTLAGLGGRDTAGRLGAYRLDLQVAGSPAALDLDAALAVQDGHLTAKGRLGLGGPPHFTGDVTVDHPEAARVLALLAPLYRPAGGTLGALALSMSLDASPTRAAIDHLSLSIGGQEVDGMVRFDRTTRPPTLDADLTASDLVLDPFLPAHEVAVAGQPVRYAALGDPGPVPGHWSRAKLDLSWLGLIDANVKVTAASATIDRWQLDKASLAFALKGGTLGLDRLSGGLCGGGIEAHGSLGSTPTGATLALTLAGRDLDLKDLAQRLGSTALSAGTGRLDADVTAAGATQADLIAALRGTASLAARDGAVGGLDLSAINDRLKTLRGPQDLVGVLQAVQSGGGTRFSALTASATIAQGVVRSTDLHLAAEGGDLTGSGTVDLPAWTIDGQAQLALAARTDLPPLAMSFSGPLDRPEKRIDVKSLAAYVEQKGLAGQLPTPAAPPQQQQKPAQQLRDLLKGLVSKPNP